MTSWIESANLSDSHFPVHNLPFGVFSRDGEAPRCAAAIGDMVVDLSLLEDARLRLVGRELHDALERSGRQRHLVDRPRSLATDP